MIRYTVTWQPQAEADLAHLWMSAIDRQVVAQASDQIDRLLSIDSESQGGAVAEGLRRLEVHPLKVIFSVEKADRIVSVLSVRLIN